VSQRELVNGLEATLAKKGTTQQQLEQQQALKATLLAPPPGFVSAPGVTFESVSAQVEEFKKALANIQQNEPQVRATHREAVAQELILCSALRGEFKAFEDGLVECPRSNST
jgi:hypothetical protein